MAPCKLVEADFTKSLDVSPSNVDLEIPQYEVLVDWDSKITETKRELENLNLDEKDMCFLFLSLVTMCLGTDLKEDSEKKMKKKLFTTLLSQSLDGTRDNSLLKRQLSVASNSDMPVINSDVLRQILHEKDNDGNTALHCASLKVGPELEDSIPLIIEMLKDKADVSLMNEKARNFLV